MKGSVESAQAARGALAAIGTDWPRLNALLDEALSLPAREREGWLQALPEEHAALKDTLARLLQVRTGVETGDFLGTLPKLEGAAVPQDEADIGTPQPGDEVGPYRLIRELGEGGMGSVWLAERADGRLKRQVALKLPRLTWARGLAERMARERDILATLEHPHIARLYDAGVDKFGRPWLALEYVQGRPIDAYARDKVLTVRQRVELLLQVCEAVAYAHSRLVIHRDLKPGNILVTDDGQVRLLDFGIAKLLQGDSAAATALTELAGRALTLDYASPEQVRGEPLTTASDVYSLGVAAYELLAGARPYRLKRGSAAELEQAIESAELPAASAVATDGAAKKALRGDLDAILSQALAKDLGQRYGSVVQLADDLRRHLQGLAVSARQTPWTERVARAVRRRPAAAAIVVGVGLALLGGLYAQAAVMLAMAIGTAVAVWQRAEAVRQRDAATRERARAAAAAEDARREAQRADQAAASEREAAVAARDQARRAERIKQLLLDAFRAADTDAGADGATTALDVLRAADRGLGEAAADDPELALELKTALAYGMAGHGEHAAALETLEAALARVPGLPRGHPLRLEALCLVGECLSTLKRAAEAVELLRPLADDAAEAGDFRRESWAGRFLGSSLLDLGDGAGAVAASERLAQLLETQADRLGPQERLHAAHTRANMLCTLRHPDALAAAQTALDIARVRYGPVRAKPVLVSEATLGLAEVLAGRPRDAATRLRAALSEMGERFGARQAHLAVFANYLVNAQLSCGDGAGAWVTLQEDASRAREAGEDPQGADAALRELMLASAAAAMRRHDDAARRAQRAAEMLEGLYDAGHPVAGQTRVRQAIELARLGRIDEADALLQAAAAHPGVEAVRLHAARCSVALDAGRTAEALEAAEALQASLGPSPPFALKAGARLWRGRALLASGEPRAAIAPLTQAREALSQLHLESTNELAEIDAALAEAELQGGDPEAAAALFERALTHWRTHGDVPRPRARAQLGLACCKDRHGRATQALALRQAAAEVLAVSPLATERALLAAITPPPAASPPPAPAAPAGR